MDLPFPTEDLARLYRFALLLTGDEGAAQQILYDACVDCAARLGSYRNEEARLAFILGNLREKARALPIGEGRGIAAAFATLPEDERAVLAGLYTGLLPARELAEALKLSLQQLGKALMRARKHLDSSGLALGQPNLEQTL